jgi:transposase
VGLPVTLVLDDARSQRCTPVPQLAKQLRIELLLLPAYAPNLNLIEQLGKFAKKEGLSCRYDEDFARFKAAIVECLEGIEGKLKLSINSLLTLNFQTCEESQLLAG